MRKFIPWLIVGLLVFVHLFTLMRYPLPFVDEGWFASRAWAFRDTHQAFGPLDRGVFDRFPGYWTFFPWIPTAFQSLAFTGATTPELMPLRLLSLLAGGALLSALFFLARSSWGSGVAWITVLLAGFSRAFFYSAHLARYDVFVAALGFWSIALVYGKKDSSAIPDLIAGILGSLAVEFHPNGVIYAPAILFLYFQFTGLATFRSRRFWCFVAGSIIGLTLYAVLHIARYPETWMQINRIAGTATHLPPLLTMNPVKMVTSLLDTIRLAAYASPFVLTLLIVAIPVLLKDQKRILSFSLIFIVIHSLLIQHKLFYYAILFTPVMDLIAAIFLVHIFQSAWGGNAFKAGARIAAGLFVLAGVIYAFLPLFYDWSEDYHRVSARLNQEIRAGETIMGSQLWWIPLYKNPWYSWESIHYYQQYKKNATFTDAMAEFRPTLLIVDDHLASFLKTGTDPADESYTSQLGLPAKEFQNMIREHGHLRSSFDGGNYGKIQLIELNWNR